MAKIMLVEDDNNLREIYEARLLAEGYEIVSAEDGEQALAMAVKEKPDLIISDVMMPKISGFDMLDILRSTPETEHTKVIMMTALSQAEDKARADKLGADRYLVKSQVTLEDVAKVAREILQDEDTIPAISNAAAEPAAPATTPAPTPVAPDPSTQPVTDDTAMAAVQPQPAAPAAPAANPVVTAAAATTDDTAQSVAGASTTVNEQISAFVQNIPGNTPPPADITDATNTAADTAADMANAVNDLLQKPNDSQPAIEPETTTTPLASNQIAGKKIIAPINDLSAKNGPDLDALLAKEMGQTPIEPLAPAPAAPLAPETPLAAPATPANEQPVDVPLPGNIQAPGISSDPNNTAL